MCNRLLISVISVLLSWNIGSTKVSEGFFDFSYNDSTGKVTLHVPMNKIDFEFLYVNSLSAGLGSNDIGLDRGQLGSTQIVKFIKTGDKLLLIQPNQKFRADSDNKKEKQAVQEAFAESVLWGFKLKKGSGSANHYEIDITDFLLRDAHGVTARLTRAKQGTYKLDKSRSAIWEPRTKNFPKNSEFESILTFLGEPKGAYIRSVAPNAKSISVRQHHSFIELPDNQYKTRAFHPYSAFGTVSFYDYATPIHEPIEKRFIRRHRLEKKDPTAAKSEAVEPIIYYLDSGCPEPIKSALMDGAKWWNQAFEAAGFINAFQVKVMPPDADPMDVRYNMIQWVHRSTRGWSYGSSVTDPRTGEIIKGHVSLGSLRVRQDFLIAQGIISPFEGDISDHTVLTELALARLRQLAAHEVGHTIGLAHNFASSVNNRASVMDYPHPIFELNSDGSISTANAYDTKIGDWDKVTIRYGYATYPNASAEENGLQQLIHDAQAKGLKFISDRDSRPAGGAHPDAHLWDNGSSAVAELNRMMTMRKSSLQAFGENTIRTGTPYSELEKVLVPLYLMPRYQIEGVSKLIGGIEYSYNVKGDKLDSRIMPVADTEQLEAATALLQVIEPSNLVLPKHVLSLISPPAFGYSRDRETFDGHTGLIFDAMGPAESLTNHTLSFMLDHQRLARILRNHDAFGSSLELNSYLNNIQRGIRQAPTSNDYESAVKKQNQQIFFMHLLKLISDDKVDHGVQTSVLQFIESNKSGMTDPLVAKLYDQAMDDPSEFKLPAIKEMPPGSPIGCGQLH